MANKAVERLIAINRSLVEVLHRRGLLPVGGAQILLQDLAEAARHIERTAVESANRAVADVRAVVKKEAAKVKASAKKVGKPAKKAAAKKSPAKKPAVKKAVAKKIVPAKKKPAKAVKRR